MYRKRGLVCNRREIDDSACMKCTGLSIPSGAVAEALKHSIDSRCMKEKHTVIEVFDSFETDSNLPC